MCDFLPDSVHNFLNNLEWSLSLPVLFIIILCTLQFLFNHSMHIICVLTEIFRKNAACKKPKKKPCPPKKKGPSMFMRLQRCLCAMVGANQITGKPGCKPSCKKRKPTCKNAAMRTPRKTDDEDDFDDEYDDDDEL